LNVGVNSLIFHPVMYSKRMEKALEDANKKLPNENTEIKQETSNNNGSDNLEYNSFGDEFDSEDIASEEESEIEVDNFE